ncbi:MAG TPA: hypothetical protein PLY95_02480, partial [Candidatus Paceibacterota bacterium]|nr:hypothetical protein [Candidatus Paceibacterota bacterium]
ERTEIQSRQSFERRGQIKEAQTKPRIKIPPFFKGGILILRILCGCGHPHLFYRDGSKLFYNEVIDTL